MNARLVLPAPAKLNLFLHVTGRRADGYHLLESVFVPIDLADTVTLVRRDDGVVRLLDPPPGLDEGSELCCRAARALQQASGCQLGVDIRVEKRIPQGAGLGGGSSDAATTLLGLNRLWSLGRTRSALQGIAAGIGADVPFFVFGQPALARGIGERLLAVTAPATQYVVAFPGTGLATVSVFSDPALRRDTPGTALPVFTLGFGHNDLQPVAERQAPAIATLRAEMARLADDALSAPSSPPVSARMTGSGACVFIQAPHHAAATRLTSALQARGWQAWAVHTLARHPLYAFARGDEDGAII